MADIPNPIPTVIPAKPEKVYDKQYCLQVVIDAKPATAWKARLVGAPYDGDVSTLPPNNFVELVDLKALALADEDLAAALQNVMTVVGKYLVKAKVKNVKQVTPENVADILAE